MSHKLRMPDLWVPHPDGRRVLVPGGWHAVAPELAAIDAESNRTWTAAFADDFAGDMRRAQREMLKRMDAVWRAAWKRAVQDSIRGWAKKFLRMYPECVALAPMLTKHEGREIWVIRGFRPEVMQRCFVPGDNRLGRRGKAWAKEMLERMHCEREESVA